MRGVTHLDGAEGLFFLAGPCPPISSSAMAAITLAMFSSDSGFPYLRCSTNCGGGIRR